MNHTVGCTGIGMQMYFMERNCDLKILFTHVKKHILIQVLPQILSYMLYVTDIDEKVS